MTTEFKDAVSDSDVVLITVPTPVNPDNSPDLSYVEAASESVISNISPGSKTAVVLESTVYPGVTRKVLGGLCSKFGLSENEEKSFLGLTSPITAAITTAPRVAFGN